MKLQSILGEFLIRAGALNPVVMGPQKKPPPSPTQEEVRDLAARFDLRLKASEWLIKLFAGLFCLLILTGGAILVVYSKDPKLVTALLGGNLIALLMVSSKLYSVWKERTLLEVLVMATASLPPAECVKLLLRVYLKRSDRRPRRQRGVRLPT
jgi:hypothetical protein